MIQTTRWKPDSCDCVIEYTWDDAVPDASRVHTLKSIQKCSIHTALVNGTAYTTVGTENFTKNRAVSLALTLIAEDRFTWSFDVQRRVLLTTSGVNNSTRTNIKNLIDSTLGTGKVIVS